MTLKLISQFQMEKDMFEGNLGISFTFWRSMSESGVGSIHLFVNGIKILTFLNKMLKKGTENLDKTKTTSCFTRLKGI